MSNAQVALITGAARRIGASIAERLHEADLRIIIHYHHSSEAAQALVDRLNQARPDSCVALQSDLTQTANCQLLIEKAVKCWGQLDLLVNNASLFLKTPIENATDTHWETLMNCNLKAPFFLAQAAANALKQTHGVIINITDIHAKIPLRDYALYTLTQAGLNHLTLALAKELAPEIRVNAIAPGAILWPEGDNALTPTQQQHIINKTALKRHGDPNDVAEAVLSLTQQNFMTGQIIAIDGGRNLVA